MYSLATRTVVRRAAVAPVSRSVVAAQRYSSTMHDNDPEVIEKEKNRNMNKEQHKTSTPIKNAPGWNQYLASASEAAVKADRSDADPNTLLHETLQHVKERHIETDSPNAKPEQVPPTPRSAVNGEERVDAYEASYEKDETTGPLKNSAPKEKQERTVFTEKMEGFKQTKSV